MGTFGRFKRIWQEFPPSRKVQLASVLFLSIVASAAEVVTLGLTMPYIITLAQPDTMFQQPAVKTVAAALGVDRAGDLLLPMTLLFVVAVLLCGLLRMSIIWAQTRLAHAIGTDLSTKAYLRTLYQPYSVHVSRNSSVVISALSHQLDIVVHHGIIPLFSIITSSIISVAIIAALIYLSSSVALSLFACIAAIYSAVVLGTRARLRDYSRAIAENHERSIRCLQEGLGGVRDVLLDSSQPIYAGEFRKAVTSLRRATANVQIIANMPRFGIEALGMVAIAGISYLMIVRLGLGANAVPILGVLALGAQRLMPMAQLIFHSLSSLRSSQSSIDNVIDLLDQPLPEVEEADHLAPLPFERTIEFKGVSFRHSPNLPWVIQNLDLAIAKGSRLGIVGPTGSGKSTLTDLLLGLLMPTEGKILIDGQPLTAANVKSWHRHVAHVPQAIFLSDASVAENIAFGVPKDQVDIDRVERTARQAHIDEVVEALPRGYQTDVGEAGIRLSGGQRQRIGIARALYKQANVIVFDEATSALDRQTERSVMRSIEELSNDITLVLVAHRETTLANCDEIVRLSADGRSELLRYEELNRE